MASSTLPPPMSTSMASPFEMSSFFDTARCTRRASSTPVMTVMSTPVSSRTLWVSSIPFCDSLTALVATAAVCWAPLLRIDSPKRWNASTVLSMISGEKRPCEKASHPSRTGSRVVSTTLTLPFLRVFPMARRIALEPTSMAARVVNGRPKGRMVVDEGLVMFPCRLAPVTQLSRSHLAAVPAAALCPAPSAEQASSLPTGKLPFNLRGSVTNCVT